MGGVNPSPPPPPPPHPPPPPPLIKQNSTFISCQGYEGTCWAHATTRLIMKLITNFFPTYFLPLHINDCNHYYDTIICNSYKIFDCFLKIKRGKINCNSLPGDNIEKEDWPEENFYALLFHIIYLILVKQFGRTNGTFGMEAPCLYILDYLKYIYINEHAVATILSYIYAKHYNIGEQLYFDELITKSVELFKAIKESLNNKNFNPIIYRVSSVVPDIYSISKYQYYTKDYECNYNDLKLIPKKEISFEEKLEKNISFSSKIINLDPVFTVEHNLRNITGKTDLPTNIKYVLEHNYYAVFYTNGHVVTITECSGSVDNLFLHMKNSSIIDTCSKERDKIWCNLIEENTISMNKLLLWNKNWDIVFFYPYESFDKQIINQFNQNTTVEINKKIFSDDEGKEIANALGQNKTVTELSFFQCTISDNTIKEIAEALKINTTLKKIFLNNNMIGINGAKAIAEALEKNTTLETIHLSINKMMGDNGTKAIAEALKINEKLKTIHLTRNAMSKDGASAIAEALKINRTLTEIDLTSNQIGDDGTKEIAKALETNETLTKINLRDNNIGIDGAKAIAEALKKNTKLETIWLNYNNIGDDGAMAIVDALKQNTILTSFNIGMNNITDKTKKNIKDSEVASRITV